MAFRRRIKLLVATALLAFVPAAVMAAPGQAAETATGLSTDNNLVTFPVDAPGSATVNSIIFPGAATDTNLVGLDYRPRGGGLYAVAAGGTFYVLAPGTVAGTFNATQINQTPLIGPFSGTDIGFDFNPAPDAIRLVTSGGADLRLSPNNGSLLGTDGNLAYAAGDVNAGDTPNVVAAGYTNSKDGTGGMGTTLYDIDSDQNALVTQGSINSTPVSPNTGQLFTVGALGADVTDNVGFDIAPTSNLAYASVETVASPGSSSFHRINLETGAATLVGNIAGGKVLVSSAIVPSSVIGFANTVTSVDERAGTAKIVVTRAFGLNREVKVNYATTGASPEATGTLTFAPNVTSQSFDVPVVNDPKSNPVKEISLALSAATANSYIGDSGTSKLQVLDVADAVTPGSPVALVAISTSKLGQVAGNGKIKVAYSCDRDCGVAFTAKTKGRTIGKASSTIDKAGKRSLVINVGMNNRKFVKKKAGRKGVIDIRLSARFTASGVSASNQNIKFRLTR